MVLVAGSLCAQSQIGGGVCSSSSLSGAYSLTLTGRDVSSSVTFSKIFEGIGTATFDGLSKVSFSLSTNTNQASGAAQTLSGAYSLQSNCLGVLTLSTGDTAGFTLESYNSGKNFLITGQDGTYAFTGSGNVLPASCGATLLSGTYAFNGTGFGLNTGAVSGVNDISGVLTFDGKSAATGTWYVSAAGPVAIDSLTGTYSVASSCSGNATLTDSAGNSYAVVLTVTSTNGNFALSGANPLLMFTGSGRPL